MLTRQGWLLVGGGGVLLAFARILGISELFVFGACALGLAAFATIHIAVKRLELEVDRSVHPARVHAGHVSRVDLRIRNLRSVDTPVLALHDPVSGTGGAELLVPPLGRGASAVATYRLPTHRRGILDVGPLTVVAADPFGLSRAVIKAAERVQVTVYPEIRDVRPVPLTAAHDPTAGSLHPHSLGRTGDEFYALRRYVVGDDLRRIHWPSTARHDELLVRQQEQPWQGRTTVLLDVRRTTHDPTSFEAAVSAAASIIVANTARRDLVRLVCTDGTDSGFGVGHGHLEALLEHLAVVQPSGSASLRRSIEVLQRSGGGGGLAVALGPATSDEIAALSRLRRAYGWGAVVQARGTPPPAGTAASRRRSALLPIVHGPTPTAFAREWNRMIGSEAVAGRRPAATEAAR